MKTKRTAGLWFILISGIFLLCFFVLGQTMSLINYDFTVALGLQEPKNVISEIGVAINKGFGAGDTIVYIPLFLAGLIGLWKRKSYGLFAMTGAFAITAYWPMCCIFFLFFARGSHGFHFSNYASYTIILTLLTVYGLWGLWYLYKSRKLLSDD